MDTLEYQRRLAEYDEQISFHEARAKALEYEKSRFVLEVLRSTEEEIKKRSMPPGVDVVQKGQ